VVDPVKIFLTSSLIAGQNPIVVSHTVCAHARAPPPPWGGALGFRPLEMGRGRSQETRSCSISVATTYSVAIGQTTWALAGTGKNLGRCSPAPHWGSRVADPLETRFCPIRVNTPNLHALGWNRFSVDRESQKNRGRLGPAPCELGGADHKKHVPASCYGTKFGRSRSYYMGVRRGGQKIETDRRKELVKQACAAEMAVRYAALSACVIVIR